MNKRIIRFFIISFALIYSFFAHFSTVSIGKDETNLESVTYEESGNITLKNQNNADFVKGMNVSDDYSDIIEPGFPVQTWHDSGIYHGGPAIHTLVGDITGNGYKEIIVTGLANGPLYAFDAKGNLLSGWPINTSNGGAQYATLHEDKVLIGSWGGDIAAFDSSGSPLWETSSGYFVTTPGSASLLPTVGTDGLFIGEEDWKIHGYQIPNGQLLSGWPYNGNHDQEIHTPAIADIDNDGMKEIIASSGDVSPSGIEVFAIREDGTEAWVKSFPNGEVDTFPVVGDVDGDNELEVVIISEQDNSPYKDIVNIVDANGNLERNWTLNGGTAYGTAPALADLNNDNLPEIIVQYGTSSTKISITDGYGNTLPGWPKSLGENTWFHSSAPVAGDVDGDNIPEIITVTQNQVHVLNHDGTYVSGFPLDLAYLGDGAVPAISDIDKDKHNEIVISGSFWNGYSGNYDKVWVFDLNRDNPNVTHGCIEWGQFMSNKENTGIYEPICPVNCVPEPISPPDYSSFSKTPIVFNWNICTDSTKYQFSLRKPFGFIDDEWTSAPLDEPTYTIDDPSFLSSGLYAWKVRSCYDATCSDTSDWSFSYHFYWNPATFLK